MDPSPRHSIRLSQRIAKTTKFGPTDKVKEFVRRKVNTPVIYMVGNLVHKEVDSDTEFGDDDWHVYTEENEWSVNKRLFYLEKEICRLRSENEMLKARLQQN